MARLRGLGRGDTLRTQTEGDVVDHGHVREERVLLEDGVHVALVGRHPGHVHTLEQDATRRRLLEAGDHLQQRGLAATGRPEQREELTLVDREVGAVHGHEVAERLVHRVQSDDRFDDCVSQGEVLLVSVGPRTPLRRRTRSHD
jgi:hypothetical protein